MKKKLLTLVMTVVMAAGILTGCGGTQDAQTSVPEESKTTKEPVAQETPVLEGKLTVWCWDPAFNINAVNTAADIYKKDHPNFELEVVEISQSDIYQKLATATAAGNTDEVLPDIILFDDALVAQAASSFQGVLMDLTDVGIDFSSFAEAKVACSVVDGRNYGIPFDSGAAIAAYRTDILADAGYTIDDFTDITWSEWIEKAVVVKEKTGKSLLNGLGAYNQFSVMLKSCGGGYFDEAGNLNIANNEKIQKISQIYLEMLDKGVFQEEIGWDTYIGNINNGNVAGAMNGCWIMSSIQMAEDQSGLWEITNIPSVDGVEGATNYSSQGGSTWTITSACKNVDLAVDFFNSTFAGSTELYDEILPTVAIATWIPAGNSDTYKQPVAYFSDQPIYSMIVDYTAKVPSSVISAYDSSSRNAVCTAITNAAYSGKDIIEELKKAEETVSFEMEQ